MNPCRSLERRAPMTAWAAVWAVTWVALTWGGVGEAMVYQLLGVGRCGTAIQELPVFSFIGCAAICLSDPLCNGFSSSANSCESVNIVSEPDMNPNYSCYITQSLYKNLTSTATTTTKPPVTQGPVMVSMSLGVSGANILGFTEDNNTFINFLSFTMYSMPVSNPPAAVKSTIVSGGETCGTGQAMVGIGSLHTSDPEKTDQRMYCANMLSPKNITSTCVSVPLGQAPRPNLTLTGTNTTSWYNWLACQNQYIITKLNWTFDNSSLNRITDYRYSAVTCCLVQ
ncbi:uncharacterized protein [Cherax quadricarinatus]|uniref:uncharacterized protein n=1 Tax=Cherax quadricarinatus TaxID=27406 RepID=UPI00237855F2|nr:uncharacterized protein LOC128693982 [Cherax quadricarinatus]